MFDQDKTTAAIGYLLKQTRESMYPLLKMLYLADKLSLSRSGRYIGGDEYCALQQGPVPSYAYDLFKAVRGDVVHRSIDVQAALSRLSYAGEHKFELVNEPDLDELSRGDIAALDDVISTYELHGSRGIRDLSHDEAWAAVWGSRGFFQKSVPMTAKDVAAATDSADWLEQALADTAPGIAELPEGFQKPRLNR